MFPNIKWRKSLLLLLIYIYTRSDLMVEIQIILYFSLLYAFMRKVKLPFPDSLYHLNESINNMSFQLLQ